MPIKLQPATLHDVPHLVALKSAIHEDLLDRFGKGFWTSASTDKGVLLAMRRSTVFVARMHGKLVASLNLSTRKPWSIDVTHFSASKRPLYLTGMAVHPAHQRTGIGRLCMEESRKIAGNWPADAIRLDAYDAPAGAGDFYRKCGLRQVAHVVYRGTPHFDFEWLL